MRCIAEVVPTLQTRTQELPQTHKSAVQLGSWHFYEFSDASAQIGAAFLASARTGAATSGVCDRSLKFCKVPPETAVSPQADDSAPPLAIPAPVWSVSLLGTYDQPIPLTESWRLLIVEACKSPGRPPCYSDVTWYDPSSGQALMSISSASVCIAEADLLRVVVALLPPLMTASRCCGTAVDSDATRSDPGKLWLLGSYGHSQLNNCFLFFLNSIRFCCTLHIIAHFEVIYLCMTTSTTSLLCYFIIFMLLILIVAVFYGRDLAVGNRDFKTAVAVSRLQPYQPYGCTKRYLHHVGCPVFVAFDELNRNGVCSSCVQWQRSSFERLQRTAKTIAATDVSMETAFRGLVTFPRCVIGAHVRPDTLSTVRHSLTIMNSCALP